MAFIKITINSVAHPTRLIDKPFNVYKIFYDLACGNNRKKWI
jgi:hypothetical protein